MRLLAIKFLAFAGEHAKDAIPALERCAMIPAPRFASKPRRRPSESRTNRPRAQEARRRITQQPGNGPAGLIPAERLPLIGGRVQFRPPLNGGYLFSGCNSR